jgi:ABC-2 type transport system ATP-binding protein
VIGAGEAEVVLRITALVKTFNKPFTGRLVQALRGISLEVRRGEIFGFLGPNGAGKTTTIKMLMGFIAPTAGTMEILGVRAPAPEVMARVGFLPENPYVYPYLSPREFVTMCGRLSGLHGSPLHARVVHVLQRVGIAYAMDRSVRALSKGMLQRVGLAAALVHDPELLVLDEPMSGLDPVGRKEVRDLIVEEKHGGRTVFFSSHILSDVEMLCDRVCILRQGEVVVSGSLRELLGVSKRRTEVTIGGASDALREALAPLAHETRAVGDLLVMEVDGDAQVRAVVERAFAEGARLESVAAKRETLEDLFVRRAL